MYFINHFPPANIRHDLIIADFRNKSKANPIIAQRTTQRIVQRIVQPVKQAMLCATLARRRCLGSEGNKLSI
jgi:hypothetical protein